MKKYTLLTVSALAVLVLLTACTKKTNKSDTSSSTSTSQVSSTSHQSSSTSTTEPASTSSGEAKSDIDPASDTADLLQDKNTGVTLESGQDTINYASMILGDKEWTVLEDNYNRTDSTPYNLLQGTDGSLYRVYQNGVIVDMDDVIVHQP
ncbi:hypothetical protein [Streptococcus acidominimus]|uniref:Translation initiation factor 1 n=1 Tax=Streptococcus acidominimus TaxID=1326 RepID=A0A1Q8EDM8_STRAI|nr:hypothetical protein [Streptococcus acidominimus]OLF49901.1 hypothetical protein BU200_04815 [Streptococcus acidominimus]SUN07732.1 translation initiation factor 1 [Streptococcus acidominimus]